MPTTLRVSLFGLIGLLATGQTACNLVPHSLLTQSQLRSRQLYEQNKSLAQQNLQTNQNVQQLQSRLNVANQRVDNLNAGRLQLEQRHSALLKRFQSNPLSEATSDRFKDLAKRYPNFEFDPRSGVSKFHSDVLFDSGSSQIKSEALPVLRDFAKILNDSEAAQLNMLVVGHTDDRRIARKATQAKHETNWHLSTNRANAVLLALKQFGIDEKRMQSAGAGMFQPLVPNKDDASRSKNRRVEIFVLAPEASVAGWSPDARRN